jgi:hypothetical protein
MVEDVLDEDVVEGAGRDVGTNEDEEEWGWFRKPFGHASFSGSVGCVSIRSEAFL